MKTEQSDRVREYARREYIEPARKRGEATVRIVAGDIVRALHLQARVPLVCSALRSGEFLRSNHLRLEDQQGPPSMQSTTVTFTYAIEDRADLGSDASLFYQLRGIAKDTYRDLGGAEAFIRSEREQLDESMSKRETK